jgi:hypothetical protein
MEMPYIENSYGASAGNRTGEGCALRGFRSQQFSGALDGITALERLSLGFTAIARCSM